MKEVKVNIGISARHLHLNQETYDLLFDHPLTVKKALNQIGQFASNETVTLKTSQGEISNVRIVGPLRSYNQVELAQSEARILGIEAPVRRSGVLDGASLIKVITPKNEVEIPAAIIANRHVHFSLDDAKKMGVVDKQKLKLEIPGVKRGVVDVEAKVSEDGFFEVHLDTDDANAFLLKNGDVGTLLIE